ncbi:DUF2213 domain-containing protein [Entomobacter blattae]|uniref:DUF2213 domain-containing protein n=1 Tax=Entomobacter blattae TaxID=2762277 RepID=A0A7H1NR60_9PROT|nr:DUF2213 domain-containing protein [Entomobacter blattae]QNT78270.1 hypothetical protein JGUZn3_10420 [Entomobacter blattae]
MTEPLKSLPLERESQKEGKAFLPPDLSPDLSPDLPSDLPHEDFQPMVCDRSLRSTDTAGRLRVERSNISREGINPYLGREIPGWKALGLVAEKIYYMYRPAEELAKAAPSFAGVELLAGHSPVSSTHLPKGCIIGHIGDDVRFIAPFLTAPLVINDADWAKKVETGQVSALSCGYDYRPEMSPGVVGGQAYDGVMRHIRGNHVALVKHGRAGPDVKVADCNPFIPESQQTSLSQDLAETAQGHIRGYTQGHTQGYAETAQEYTQGHTQGCAETAQEYTQGRTQEYTREKMGDQPTLSEPLNTPYGTNMPYGNSTSYGSLASAPANPAIGFTQGVCSIGSNLPSQSRTPSSLAGQEGAISSAAKAAYKMAQENGSQPHLSIKGLKGKGPEDKVSEGRGLEGQGPKGQKSEGQKLYGKRSDGQGPEGQRLGGGDPALAASSAALEEGVWDRAISECGGPSAPLPDGDVTHWQGYVQALCHAALLHVGQGGVGDKMPQALFDVVVKTSQQGEGDVSAPSEQAFIVSDHALQVFAELWPLLSDHQLRGEPAVGMAANDRASVYGTGSLVSYSHPSHKAPSRRSSVRRTSSYRVPAYEERALPELWALPKGVLNVRDDLILGSDPSVLSKGEGISDGKNRRNTSSAKGETWIVNNAHEPNNVYKPHPAHLSPQGSGWPLGKKGVEQCSTPLSRYNGQRNEKTEEPLTSDKGQIALGGEDAALDKISLSKGQSYAALSAFFQEMAHSMAGYLGQKLSTACQTYYRNHFTALYEAECLVSPVYGYLGCDSAEAVYDHVLTQAGIECPEADLPLAAKRFLVEQHMAQQAMQKRERQEQANMPTPYKRSPAYSDLKRLGII